jgi:hypothetical protein
VANSYSLAGEIDMSLHMELWQVNGNQLQKIKKSSVDNEKRLQDWIADDPSLLGLDLLVIGREVTTYSGRIDLLAIDIEGNLVVLELKRDRTPRNVVAQTLDYASWVKNLTNQQILASAQNYLKKPLSVCFSEHFGTALPDELNVNHSMIIVASELDDASERIVQYLVTEHEVNINVIFFNFFQTDSKEIVGRAWLMDPIAVEEQSKSREQFDGTGYYYVNLGDGECRNWEDNVKYGYVGAGQGVRYSRALRKLRPGDKIFAYLKEAGYVGYGQVLEEAVPITKFIVETDERPLLEHVTAPLAHRNKDDLEKCEWAARINWIKTFSREKAKKFTGIFTHPLVVCKLRHPETLQFLEQQFEIKSEAG